MHSQSNEDHAPKDKGKDFKAIKEDLEIIATSKFMIVKEKIGLLYLLIIVIVSIICGIYIGYYVSAQKVESLKEDNNYTTKKLAEARADYDRQKINFDIKVDQISTKENAIQLRDVKISSLKEDISKLQAEIARIRNINPEDIIYNQLVDFNAKGIRENNSYTLSERFRISIDDKCSLKIFDRNQDKSIEIHFQRNETHEIRFGNLKINADFRFKGGICNKGPCDTNYQTSGLCFFTFTKSSN